MDDDVLSALFSNSNFSMDFSDPLLDLIEYGRAIVSIPPDLPRNLSAPEQRKNVRHYSFPKALVKWIDRRIPYHPENSSISVDFQKIQKEHSYLDSRKNKAFILSSLAFWGLGFDKKGPAFFKQKNNLFKWIANIHLGRHCQRNPASALMCIIPFSIVADQFPQGVANIFHDVLVKCSLELPPQQLFDILFPMSGSMRSFNREKDLGPDPDLLILSFYAPEFAKLKNPQNQHAYIDPIHSSYFQLTDRSFLFNQSTLPIWHCWVIHDVLFRLMMKLCNQLRTSCKFSSTDETINLLSYDDSVDAFSFFQVWVTQFQQASIPVHKMRSTSNNDYNEFCEVFPKICLRSFTKLFRDLQKKLITVEQIYFFRGKRLLFDALRALKFTNAREVVRKHQGKILLFQGQVGSMQKICKTFFPKDPAFEILKDAEARWNELRIIDLMFLFGEVLEAPPSTQPPPGQLPLILIESINWMSCMLNSNLFSHIWDHDEGGNRASKIIQIRKKWQQLFKSIVDKTITFPQLSLLVNLLVDEKELELLYTTTSQETSKLSYHVRGVDHIVVSSMRQSLSEFVHFQGLFKNIKQIANCLPYFKNWIRDHGSVEKLQSYVKDFQVLIKKNKWDKQKLSSYNKFATTCENIPSSLFSLNSALFQKILEADDLFNWLRTQSDDQDFQNGIEVAMCRSEMECPSKLWINEDGSSGRVNEQILSMLQSVRSYLHSFIYRKELIFDDMRDFIASFLSQLQPFEDKILVSINTCIQYCGPLIELLTASPDGVAPERLLKLLQPSSNGFWVCDSKLLQNEVSTDSISGVLSVLRLKYYISTKDESISRQMIVSEIEDFQSTVILSQTDQKSKSSRDKINNFVESFSWMKKYASCLLSLHSLGHFHYDTFLESISIQNDSEFIHEKVVKVQELLSEWESMVIQTRMKYSSMNYFGMKLIRELVQFLWKRVKCDSSSSITEDIVKTMAYLINPVSVFNDDLLVNVNRELLSCWVHLTSEDSDTTDDRQILEAFEDDDLVPTPLSSGMNESPPHKAYKERTLSLEELLDSCGKVVQQVYGKIPLCIRRVEISKCQQTLKFRSGDVHLICSPSYELVFPQVLSAYLPYGVLPERRNLLLCHEDTPWEEVLLFLFRWKHATTTDEDPLFCLANPDILSNSIQNKCASLIYEFVDTTVVPFVLVCGPSKNVYIVSQFFNRTMAYFPFQRSVIQNFVQRAFSGHVGTFVSNYAGEGKSFHIRIDTSSSISLQFHRYQGGGTAGDVHLIQCFLS